MKYLSSPIKSICPVCNSNSGLLLYIVRSKQVAKHFLYTSNALSETKLDELSKHISDNLWKAPDAKVIECVNCRFTYANPFISGDYFFYNTMLHGEAEIGDGVNSEEKWDWEFEEARKCISKIVNEQANPALLEIGASTGVFIKRISNELINKNDILCLEYSELGVSEIKKLGIEALSKDVRELVNEEKVKGKFDIICLFQVFEHLDNYDKLFETFDYLASDGANLIMAVPNGERIKFNELNGGLLDLPPNHLGRFNKKSFEMISKKYNWEIKYFKIQEETYHQILGGLLYYRSLQKKIVSDKIPTKIEHFIDYITINFIKLKILFNRNKIGDNIFIHLKKVGI